MRLFVFYRHLYRHTVTVHQTHLPIEFQWLICFGQQKNKEVPATCKARLHAMAAPFSILHSVGFCEGIATQFLQGCEKLKNNISLQFHINQFIKYWEKSGETYFWDNTRTLTFSPQLYSKKFHFRHVPQYIHWFFLHFFLFLTLTNKTIEIFTKIHAKITIIVVENREPYYFIIICKCK